MKNLILLSVMSFLFLATSCQEKQKANAAQQISEEKKSRTFEGREMIFPQGEKGPSDFFTGNAYPYGLVENDSIYTTLAGNVFFEAGARSNWHSHPAGQILIVIDGVGYHQIEGWPKETIKKGDVIKCPPNTNHWHGASKDKSMTHIYIIPNTEKGIVEWNDAVTDEEYSN